MKSLFFVAATLLCSAVLALGQATQGSPMGQTAGAPAGGTSSGKSTVSLTGCLSGSGGTYTLRDAATGNNYTLTGDTKKLADHVDHQVQLTGTMSGMPPKVNETDAKTSAAADTHSAGANTFHVLSVHHVGNACTGTP